MPLFEIAPFKCRLDKMSGDGISGTSCHEFCLYDFPGCAGCPHVVWEKPVMHLAEDPMKSAVLRGWIRGMLGGRNRPANQPCDSVASRLQFSVT